MRRNEGGQAEYTCPNCLLIEMGKGERMPLPQSAVLGAKDLPKTFLSDHIEHRLARRLKQERLERARGQGKGYNEVSLPLELNNSYTQGQKGTLKVLGLQMFGVLLGQHLIM